VTTLVIRRGDLLVTSSGEAYHIRDLERYRYDPGSTPSIQSMTVETVSVKRNPAILNGKRGEPQAVAGLEAVKCTPFDSLPGEMHLGGQGLIGGLPSEFLETVIDGGDVYYYAVLERRESTQA
jgi:hypothetical protein